MTLGILDAIKEHEIESGRNMVIVTVDAEQAAVDALKAGRVNCVVECNPKIGPQVMDMVKRLVNGGTIPKLTHVTEGVFTESDDLSKVEARGY